MAGGAIEVTPFCKEKRWNWNPSPGTMRAGRDGTGAGIRTRAHGRTHTWRPQTV